jgi:hypothetical protein
MRSTLGTQVQGNHQRPISRRVDRRRTSSDPRQRISNSESGRYKYYSWSHALRLSDPTHFRLSQSLCNHFPKCFGIRSKMSPISRKDELRSQFVGKTLHDVPTPSVVLDLARIDVNCQRMLEAVERLSLSWRPHIKTHKAGPGKLRGNVRLDIDLLCRIVDDRAYATTSW